MDTHALQHETYDTVVVGGTAGGIATAVRAAREGTPTLLVTYNEQLGGMMAGGLSYTDTLVMKPRAPILDEFFERVREHYETAYGRESRQYEYCEDGYIFEPHVAEETFEALVADEDDLTVVRGYYPESVTRSNGTVNAVAFESFDGDDSFAVNGSVFVDATYEGDLLATAGVSYRVGRESRSEHDEQFAGRIFTGIRGDRYYPREAVGHADDSAPMDRRGPLHVPEEKRQGELDLRPHPAGLTEIFPGSDGSGDDAIQAYNYRLCLSRDPQNRRLPARPESYDREEFLEELEDVRESGLRSYLSLRYLPNDKADMNSADLPGQNYDYPEGSWETREAIARRHREYALGLLYFLQNDEAVPDDIRSDAREWGLAADEFVDNDNFPWQFYVREARRLDGRYTFTERDARLAPGLDRAPVHDDAVAFAEYPLDSHACREVRRSGGQPEGFFYASQVTRPSQIPYRALLPKDVSNLVVPVAVSSTHVGYGTIRLEPTWMHIGEAAGVAASLANERDLPPAALDADALQRRLAEAGVSLSFFNDVDAATDEPWAPAVQYLATKGFFESYDVRPTEPLTRSVAEAWAIATASVIDGGADDATERATAVRADVRAGTDAPVTGSEFVAMLRSELDGAELSTDGIDEDEADEPIARGEACRLVYSVLGSARNE
ncbi:FAD-dependent oxidoreductase [Halosolutus gelatinilyticus]|uniref:FAD-dependent oxidoreductase n=1 Tax=Halosolutus gelatinilyticus TaxID=2931975 RepID=UPI001FF6DD68|nr:FAD-dependent oxidoreductase [Halosolutus gelatinilyticus]